MKIKTDVLKISAPLGEKLEPEEKSATRVLSGSVVPTMSISKQAAPRAMKAEIVLGVGSVLDLAKGIRRFCGDCKHYDNAAWLKAMKQIENGLSPVKKEDLNQIRGHLIASENAFVLPEDDAGETDVEAAMQMLGKCRALTDHLDDLYLVMPHGCCPQEVVSPTSPDGFFQPRDRAANKRRDNAYDTVMNHAKK